MNDQTHTQLSAGTPNGQAPPPAEGPLDRVAVQARQAGENIAAAAGAIAQDALARATSVSDAVTKGAVSSAEDQKQHMAGGLDDVARAMHRAGEQFEGQQDWIAHLVERGADELGALAATLRTNDLQGLLGKLEELARRQPAVFVGAAMAAGFATVRLGRVVVAGASREDLPTLPEVLREPI